MSEIVIPPSTIATKEADRFVDRDLSLLEFNRRVLEQALDPRTPLLERLRFLGIFTSNLDEFFMKRVGKLQQSASAESPNSAYYVELLQTLRARLGVLLESRARCFQEELLPALQEHGICLPSFEELRPEEREFADAYFLKNAFPVLTPLAVDPGHPFPFLSNLSSSLAVSLRYPDREGRLFARVKVPPSLPAVVELPGTPGGARRYLRLRHVILHHLGELFPGMRIGEILAMRVTRNADVEYEDVVAKDLLNTVAEQLRRRRLQQVVRLEHGPVRDPWLLKQVVETLELEDYQIYATSDDEFDYNAYSAIAGLPLPSLRYPRWQGVNPEELATETDVFSAIREGDVLLHHPYDGFDETVTRFLREAAEDRQVLAIKMTLYRAGDDSPFIPLLIQAAESGKQVACLVELKARFDEDRNIRWANILERAGVHVVYGLMGVKTHTKTALVVRREGDGLRPYVHIGSGNYNPQTARQYTDFGLFTCDPDLCNDVVELFNALTGRSLSQGYRKLLVAPTNMKGRFLRMIHRETMAQKAGEPAGIIVKINQLEDRDLCEALYQASVAGVPITLLVRGFCVLRPGVPDLSPTIQVVSLIGRFLEHSRLFYFRNRAAVPQEGEFYIGSADWMVRNLEHRVEAVAPVENPALRERLWGILQIMREDRCQAWEMLPDGRYQRREPSLETPAEALLGTHELLMRRAARQNRAPPETA